MVGRQRGQPTGLIGGADRGTHHRPDSGGDVDVDPGGLERHDDVGKEHRAIDTMPTHGLERDLGRELGRQAGLQHPDALADCAVLGQRSPGLAHEPHRQAVRSLTARGTNERGVGGRSVERVLGRERHVRTVPTAPGILAGMVMALVGASHHEVSLEDLDALAQGAEQLVPRIMSCEVIRGVVVLATCNRVEYYVDAVRFHDAVDHVTSLVAQSADQPVDHVVDVMRVTVGQPIAEHLFSVAAGLESMVVGETEISGQVGRALNLSREHGATSPALERLFQKASRTAKQVTSVTGLGAAGRSLVGVGLDLAAERHGDLTGARALIIGTGAYARISAQALRRRGCTTISSYSATGRAERFARAHDLDPVGDDDLPRVLREVELVVACSGVHDFVVRPEIAVDPIRARRRPLPIIDLALHSDVHPDVRELDSVDYISLDVIGEHAPTEHADIVEAARDIVRDAVDSYADSELGRSADPVVVALREHVDRVVEQEVDRVLRRAGADAADVVAQSLHRVTSALLHTPTMRARQFARVGDGMDYARALHTLFGIDVPLDSAPGDPTP